LKRYQNKKEKTTEIRNRLSKDVVFGKMSKEKKPSYADLISI